MKGGFLLLIVLLCLLNAAWLNRLNQKYDCPASVRVKRDRYRHVLFKKFNKIPCAGDIGKCVYIFNLKLSLVELCKGDRCRRRDYLNPTLVS